MTKILVAEDDNLVRQALIKILNKFNYEVDSAIDGQQASELYTNQNLVISDINMPGLNGADLFYAIKKQNPEVAFMFVSGGVPDHINIEEILQHKKVTITLKPFDIDTLITLVEGSLSDKPTNHQIFQMALSTYQFSLNLLNPSAINIASMRLMDVYASFMELPEKEHIPYEEKIIQLMGQTNFWQTLNYWFQQKQIK